MSVRRTRSPKWKESPVVDGVGEVKLLAWRYFYDFIHLQMLNFETYIWRGLRCDNYVLESTLTRLLKKRKISSKKTKASEREVLYFVNAHLEQFKYAVRGRRGNNPAPLESENDWWSLGQHHGLATPLLDWTTSPFVAAYFAFIGNGDDQTRYRVVYALHKPSIEVKTLELSVEENKLILQKKKDINTDENTFKNLLSESRLEQQLKQKIRKEKVEFVKPLSDENQRLVNQSGLFTRVPLGESLEDWVKKNFKGEEDYVLIKILIPNENREECLKVLNRMNINHLTLFPDLYGASKFCNLFAEIEKY